MRLRTRNSARSSASPSSPEGGESMICSISGRVALALSPITAVFTGTWRQPVDGAGQTDAAGVMLLGRVVGVGVDQALAVGEEALNFPSPLREGLLVRDLVVAHHPTPPRSGPGFGRGSRGSRRPRRGRRG